MMVLHYYSNKELAEGNNCRRGNLKLIQMLQLGFMFPLCGLPPLPLYGFGTDGGPKDGVNSAAFAESLNLALDAEVPVVFVACDSVSEMTDPASVVSILRSGVLGAEACG